RAARCHDRLRRRGCAGSWEVMIGSDHHKSITRRGKAEIRKQKCSASSTILRCRGFYFCFLAFCSAKRKSESRNAPLIHDPAPVAGSISAFCFLLSDLLSGGGDRMCANEQLDARLRQHRQNFGGA